MKKVLISILGTIIVSGQMAWADSCIENYSKVIKAAQGRINKLKTEQVALGLDVPRGTANVVDAIGFAGLAGAGFLEGAALLNSALWLRMNEPKKAHDQFANATVIAAGVASVGLLLNFTSKAITTSNAGKEAIAEQKEKEIRELAGQIGRWEYLIRLGQQSLRQHGEVYLLDNFVQDIMYKDYKDAVIPYHDVVDQLELYYQNDQCEVLADRYALSDKLMVRLMSLH